MSISQPHYYGSSDEMQTRILKLQDRNSHHKRKASLRRNHANPNGAWLS